MTLRSASNALLSHQCHGDIHGCVIGFVNLSQKTLNSKGLVYITPVMINSDILVKNTSNQMRATYNGANSIVVQANLEQHSSLIRGQYHRKAMLKNLEMAPCCTHVI